MVAGTFYKSAPRRQKPMAKKYATKRGVKQLIAQAHETNFKQNGDSTGLVMAIDTSAGFTGIQLSDMAKGDGDSERIGDNATLLTLKFGGMVIATHSEPVPFRIVIVQWYGEAQPTLKEVISPTGSTIQANDIVGTQFNHDHRKFYKILYSKRGIIGTVADTGPPAEFQNVQSRTIRKFGHKRVLYRASGISGQNNIWLFAVSNQTVASGDAPLLQYSATLEYSG